MRIRERLGISQWFRYEDRTHAQLARKLLRELGVRHLRVDVSWAEYVRPGGREWYAWLLKSLEGFELLLGIRAASLAPPDAAAIAASGDDAARFAAFVRRIVEEHGRRIDAIELEEHDLTRSQPASVRMISRAIDAIAPCGKKIILGGTSPADPRWLSRIGAYDRRTLASIHAIGVHAFSSHWYGPGTGWRGLNAAFADVPPAASAHPLWITETGRSAPGIDSEGEQMQHLMDVASIYRSVERIYWRTLLDLPPAGRSAWHGHEETPLPKERSLGLVTADGRRKMAYFAMRALQASSRS